MTTWNEHVMNGEAYSAEDFILGAGGLYPHVQLFNPVDSGIRVRLRHGHKTGTGQANIRRYDPPGPDPPGPPAGFVVENLLGGGPPAVAELRKNNIIIPSGSAFWLVQPLAATQPGVYPPAGQEWGMDLLEGHGILFQGSIGTTVIINWQWVEVPL